ncbi:MAG: ssDNA-binding domain-containing protein [Clostridia bacterium]|nr:ssDNA-binding domain-containing protein [Clostridia bacterium]
MKKKRYLSKEERGQINGLERLTPQRQELVQLVMSNLQSGLGLWRRNWTPSSAPISGVNGKCYRGVNNLYLEMVAMNRGYVDNRWVTYNQVVDHGWKFKKNPNGVSYARGKGVLVEFFDFLDRTTKEKFDIAALNGKTPMEKEEYIRKNVYPLRKVYRVFNADLIEGMPPRKDYSKKTGENERVEELLANWSKHEAKIAYGGDDAYYIKSKDTIQLPPRETFATYPEFYSTALHELAHSTGHPSRLDRDFYGYGTEEYSREELRAEISSLFLCQEYGVNLTDRNMKNESAYIRNWIQEIQQDPNALFKAIADADRISRFVTAKEHQFSLQKEMEDEDAAAAFGGRAKEGVMEGVMEGAKEGTKRVAADGSLGGTRVYMPPSQIVSDERSVAMKSVDPLIALSDVSVYEHCAHTRSGGRFLALYNGRNVMGNMEKSREFLFSRLAVFTQDEQQLCRIMKSSALYDKSLPDTYYSQMAKDAVEDLRRMRKEGVQSSMHRQKPTDRMPQPGDEKAG